MGKTTEFPHIELLVRHIFGENYEAGLRYLRSLVFHPARTCPVLILEGHPACGKSIFIKMLNILLGDKGVAEVRIDRQFFKRKRKSDILNSRMVVFSYPRDRIVSMRLIEWLDEIRCDANRTSPNFIIEQTIGPTAFEGEEEHINLYVPPFSGELEKLIQTKVDLHPLFRAEREAFIEYLKNIDREYKAYIQEIRSYDIKIDSKIWNDEKARQLSCSFSGLDDLVEQLVLKLKNHFGAKKFIHDCLGRIPMIDEFGALIVEYPDENQLADCPGIQVTVKRNVDHFDTDPFGFTCTFEPRDPEEDDGLPF